MQYRQNRCLHPVKYENPKHEKSWGPKVNELVSKLFAFFNSNLKIVALFCKISDTVFDDFHVLVFFHVLDSIIELIETFQWVFMLVIR